MEGVYLLFTPTFHLCIGSHPCSSTQEYHSSHYLFSHLFFPSSLFLSLWAILMTIQTYIHLLIKKKKSLLLRYISFQLWPHYSISIYSLLIFSGPTPKITTHHQYSPYEVFHWPLSGQDRCSVFSTNFIPFRSTWQSWSFLKPFHLPSGTPFFVNLPPISFSFLDSSSSWSLSFFEGPQD